MSCISAPLESAILGRVEHIQDENRPADVIDGIDEDVRQPTDEQLPDGGGDLFSRSPVNHEGGTLTA